MRAMSQTYFLLSILLLIAFDAAHAAIAIPGANGSDGVFEPQTDTVIDLSLALNGDVDLVSGAGHGVYDASRWAVVFRYSSVSIPAGVTVSFKNHPAGAPVVWLVSGSVTIDGSVDLGGESYQASRHSEPGPGGFRGGVTYLNGEAINSGGFGPGGGQAGGIALAAHGSVGSLNFNASNASNGEIYGNARILPLIGGSGGGGGGDLYYADYGGGAGGGAILIAATATVNLNGSIIADGGDGKHYGSGTGVQASGSGGGGAVRIVADLISGDGSVSALGGTFTWNTSLTQIGGSGRVRLEANQINGILQTYPSTDLVLPDDPVVVWPPADAPTITVVSVGEETAPGDPHASLEIGQVDISLPNATTTNVVLETTNVDIGADVNVRVVPKHGQPFSTPAVLLSGTSALATWQATITPPNGYFVVQAKAVNP